MSVVTEIDLLITGTEVQASVFGPPSHPQFLGAGGTGALARKVTLASGTGSNQADLLYSAELSLAATPTSLDLAGVLANAFGDTLTFVTVKGFMIRNASTTTAEVVNVGGNANAFASWLGAATHEVVIGPSGQLLVTSPIDGYAVTGGTGDVLDLDPGAATITVQVMIWGTSA